MNAPAFERRHYEFCFAQLDTLVQVEHDGETVVVRATRDTFSSQRKEYFIHELAAEGFIPDVFRWYSTGNRHFAYPVHWLVDINWLTPDRMALRRTRRIIVRALVGATLLWMFILGLLFSGAFNRS